MGSYVEVVIETCINRAYEIIPDSYDAGFICKLWPSTYMTRFFAVYLLALNLRPRLSFIYFFLWEKKLVKIERKCDKLQLTNTENMQARNDD